jgi:hypothetical protein
VREAPTALVSTRSRPTESHRNRRPVCWQCGGTGHLRKECPWRPAKEVADKRDWRTHCAAGGRDNASRHVATSTPTSARNTLLLHEKRRLEACNVILERQIKELNEKIAELGAALERETKATITAPKEEDSETEGQRRASCRRVGVVAAATPDGRDRAALTKEQLASDRVKARQDRLANSAGFSEGDHVWPYRPTRNRGKSPKLQSSWEGS